jgi:hypothetical protein
MGALFNLFETSAVYFIKLGGTTVLQPHCFLPAEAVAFGPVTNPFQLEGTAER